MHINLHSSDKWVLSLPRGEIVESTVALVGFGYATLLAQGADILPKNLPTTTDGAVIMICVICVGFLIKSMHDARADRNDLSKEFTSTLGSVTKDSAANRDAFRDSLNEVTSQHEKDREAWLESVAKQNDRIDDFGSELRRLTEKVSPVKASHPGHRSS